MKSASIEVLDRTSRQCVHRRKASRSLPFVNGGESRGNYVAEAARQLYHDHHPCTKSSRALPCETDHIYAICGDNKNVNKRCVPVATTTEGGKKNLGDVFLLHLDLIQQLKKELEIKEREVSVTRRDNDQLKSRLHRERRMCMLRNNHRLKSDGSTENQINVLPEKSREPPVRFVTKVIGRGPRKERALKRRILRYPYNMKLVSSPVISSWPTSSHQESTSSVEKPSSSKELRHDTPEKEDVLTTNKLYYVADYPPSSPDPEIASHSDEIKVPSYRKKHFTSFYQIEGTEDITNESIERLHLKYEQDEKRRKRWDLQRLREQRATEKLLRKHTNEDLEQQNCIPRTFLPPLPSVKKIESADDVPVCAWGANLMSFVPSPFSLLWLKDEKSQKKARNQAAANVT